MPIQNRVLACTRAGFQIGVMLSLWVGLNAVLRGSTTLVVRGRDVNVFLAIAIYLLGGIIAGAIVGLLLPLVRWRLGAALVGILALFPTMLAVVMTVGSGYANWTTAHTLTVVISSVALGGTLGIIYREMFYEPK